MAITLQQAQELTQQPIDFINNFWHGSESACFALHLT